MLGPTDGEICSFGVERPSTRISYRPIQPTRCSQDGFPEGESVRYTATEMS